MIFDLFKKCFSKIRYLYSKTESFIITFHCFFLRVAKNSNIVLIGWSQVEIAWVMDLHFHVKVNLVLKEIVIVNLDWLIKFWIYWSTTQRGLSSYAIDIPLCYPKRFKHFFGLK